MSLTAAPMALSLNSTVGESDDSDDTAELTENLAEEEETEVTSDETENLSSMTVAELKALAKAKGITGYSSMTKAELISALSEAE